MNGKMYTKPPSTFSSSILGQELPIFTVTKAFSIPVLGVGDESSEYISRQRISHIVLTSP